MFNYQQYFKTEPNNKEYFNVFETNYINFTIKYDSEFDDYIKLINEEV